jgi:hypothetical protein
VGAFLYFHKNGHISFYFYSLTILVDSKTNYSLLKTIKDFQDDFFIFWKFKKYLLVWNKIFFLLCLVIFEILDVRTTFEYRIWYRLCILSRTIVVKDKKKVLTGVYFSLWMIMCPVGRPKNGKNSNGRRYLGRISPSNHWTKKRL